MPNDIKRPRFNDFLYRLFGIDSTPPSPYLAPEITPVMNVEPFGLEHYWLHGERLCGAQVTAAAVVAKRHVFRLLNPVASNTFAIVDSIVMSTVLADQFRGGVAYFTAALPQLPLAPGTCIVDTRAGSTVPKPSCSFSFDDDPPGIIEPTVFNTDNPASTPFQYNVGVVLAPGSCFDFQNSVLNVACRASIRWRERTVTELELNA